MSDSTGYAVRPMRRSEASFVKGLLKEDAGATGTDEEIDTWRAVDADAFAVAVFEGKIIGCCASFKLGETHGHIAMVLPPSAEHSSILAELMNNAMNRLSGRKITFNCPADLQNDYQKFGLNNVSSNKWVVCTLKCAKDLKVFRATHVYRSIALSEHTMIERVLDYDTTLHPYGNRDIVKNTFAEAGCVARVFVGNKEVSGYACLRRLFTGGWRVAPIICEDGGGALCLVQDLLLSLTSVQLEQGVSFIIPSDNEVAIDLAKTMGFSVSDKNERVTLSNQSLSNATPDWLYGIHSPIFCMY